MTHPVPKKRCASCGITKHIYGQHTACHVCRYRKKAASLMRPHIELGRHVGAVVWECIRDTETYARHASRLARAVAEARGRSS